MILDINKNYGIKFSQKKLSEPFVGGEPTLRFQTVLSDGNWSPFLPSGEPQKGVSVETYACVSFTAVQSIETQLNRMLVNGYFSPELIAEFKTFGWIDPETGKFNFAERFTAKMSGTDESGNDFENVWKSICNDGLVGENDWTFPYQQTDPPFTWNDYYAEIPQAIKDKAKLFLKYFSVQWLDIVDGANQMTPSEYQLIKQHLLQAPLQLAGPTCPPWNVSDVIQPCGKTEPTHSVLIYNATDTEFDIFDHYVPYQKRLASNYCIPYICKGVVTLKAIQEPPQAPSQPISSPVPPIQPPKHIFASNLKIGDYGVEVGLLQAALRNDGEFSGVATGFYGSETRRAVQLFQKKYNIGTPFIRWINGGNFVGTMTREQLNKF